MGKKIGIMVCRLASAPHKPGYAKGYHCELCKTEVQVSPTGVARIEELYVLCQDCGWAMRQKLIDSGVNVEDQIGPGAVETLFELIKKQAADHE